MFLAMDDTRHYFGGYMEAQRPLTIEAYPGLGSSVKDSPLLVFRSMGGYLLFHIYTGKVKNSTQRELSAIFLLFSLFSGPSPADVMGQLRSHLGPPRLPPLWSMGYHVCRRTGNPQDFGINYSNMTSAEIPYDSDCIDEGLLSSANQLSTSQDDPSQLFFQDALDYMSNEATSRIKLLIANPVQVAINAPDYGGGTYVKNEQGGIVIGNYNSENASIPDFPASSEWWSTGVSNLLNHPELVNNTVGMSLIHNSPYLVLRDGEECNMTSVTYIPYELRRSFGKGTLCPNHRHRDGTVDHLSAHNRYGKDVTEATINSLQGGGPGDRHKVSK